MRLALFYAARFYQSEGATFVQPAYGKYVEALARQVDELVLCGPVADRVVPGSGLELRAPNIEVVRLPYYQRDTGALRVLPSSLRGISRALEGADLASIMLPLGVMGPVIFAQAARRGVPLFLHVVGDLREQWSPEDYGAGLRGLLGLVVEGVELAQQRMIDGTFTFAQGTGLIAKHDDGRGRIVEAMETTIGVGDVRSEGRRWEGGTAKLLYAGNLIRPKGVHVLLSALAELRDRGRTYSLAVLGTGPFEDELKALARELGLADTVTFHGFQDLQGVLSHMDDADVFVFPSFGEGMPRVLLEAMARGLPIIATDVGGIGGVIEDGRNGRLVSPGSSEALAEAVGSLTQDPELWEGFSREGLVTAMEHTMDRYSELMVRELRGAGLWPAV
ncbi:MAG: glycosyltransferase [Planctomycetota bacterium]|jgi:glycosyltransferase involved in cell wall biosynthesis